MIIQYQLKRLIFCLIPVLLKSLIVRYKKKRISTFYYIVLYFFYFLGGRSDLLANRKVEEAFIGMDTTYYVVTISNINHCDNIKGHLNPKPL